MEVHAYSARIDLPSLSTSIEPEPAAEAPAAVESADSETVETIVVALPGEGAEAVSLDAAHDDAIQIVDEEVQGLPTEEEVDAMMGGAASALLTSGLTVDHVADEPTDLEATTAAEAGEDQDDGEIVDLDEIEIDAPMLLDVNNPSAAGYELSITVAQEPGIAADVMRPDAEATAETATASETSIPVEAGGGEVEAISVAEPEPDRAENLEAVVDDLPTRTGRFADRDAGGDPAVHAIVNDGVPADRDGPVDCRRVQRRRPSSRPGRSWRSRRTRQHRSSRRSSRRPRPAAIVDIDALRVSPSVSIARRLKPH